MKRTMCISLLLLASAAHAADDAPHWKILSEKSRIEWTASYIGQQVTGSFPRFSTDIAFSPEHLDKSRVRVSIPTTDVVSSDKDAAASLPTADWFASSDYPAALFEATNFHHLKDNRYEAVGTLSLRGHVVPVTLPFTLVLTQEPDGVEDAEIKGETTLKRLDFGVGQGDWAKTDAVADAVKVAVTLSAYRKK